jgi:outer membrane biosynthesis protein TonB
MRCRSQGPERVELPLDLAALKSVSGWRFEPAQLEGKAAPVRMTVTVNFTLQ